MLIANCYSNVIRAEGQSGKAMMGQLLGNLLNVILDPIMILVFGWSIAGAAIATVIGNVVGAGYYIVYFLKGSSSLSISLKDFSVKEKVASGVLAIGVPAALGNLLMSLSSIIMNSQMAKYGDMAVAGVGVAMKVTMMTGMVCIGLGQGVQPLLGYTFLLIALQTGMRRGEIVGLQWSDIDFESRMIRLRHNAVLGRYETTVSELMKTKAGRRDIPMSNEVEAWLRKQRDRSSSKFVLSLKNKKVMTLSAFRSMWKLIERELPETHITAHILRHTYITRLFEAGLDVKEIQYLAGHSTMDMTLSVYTHYDRKNREQQTAEKVRRAFCKEAV